MPLQEWRRKVEGIAYGGGRVRVFPSLKVGRFEGFKAKGLGKIRMQALP
jgi:hypothetical protein